MVKSHGVVRMTDEPASEDFQLLEGWMFGVMMFPMAMAEVIRVPPANDQAADED